MPMNLHESMESAKQFAKDIREDKYAFTVVVDLDCFDINALPEREPDKL